MKGSVAKRCACAPQVSAKGERIACKLKHGSWSYVADLGIDPVTGKRRQDRKGGFASKKAAEDALADRISQINTGRVASDSGVTLGAYLATWIDMKERNGLRRSTVQNYRTHINDIFVPELGRVRLRDVRPEHIAKLLVTLDDGNRKAATIRRIHATLRSALSSAVKAQLITWNPARGETVELPRSIRPKVRPWEPSELAVFLDYAAANRLGALFEVLAFSGLRRGEALGLRWDDIDLTAGVITVRNQLTEHASSTPDVTCPHCGRAHRRLAFSEPKTASGTARIVDIDPDTIGIVIGHRLRQDMERGDWASAYSDHGLVFARENGDPILPSDVTALFSKLIGEVRMPADADGKRAPLRKVRLHDLRHGQASLMLASGEDMALVSKRLGHSQLSITVDTYAHLLGGVGQAAATRAAAQVPRVTRDSFRDQSVTNPAELVTADGSGEITREGVSPGGTGSFGKTDGGASRTRTDDLTDYESQHVRIRQPLDCADWT